jgi:hypothetical protein
MKTQIILQRKLTILKEYDFILTLHNGDIMNIDEISYTVFCNFLDSDNNIMKILVFKSNDY